MRNSIVHGNVTQTEIISENENSNEINNIIWIIINACILLKKNKCFYFSQFYLRKKTDIISKG